MAETVDTSAQKENTEEEMKELYETSLKNLQDGNILNGKVSMDIDTIPLEQIENRIHELSSI